jgi:hypothetical protein
MGPKKLLMLYTVGYCTHPKCAGISIAVRLLSLTLPKFGAKINRDAPIRRSSPELVVTSSPDSDGGTIKPLLTHTSKNLFFQA